MDFYEKMIFYIAKKAVEECDYEAMGVLLNQFAQQECHNILQRIQDIIRDDSLNDEKCYTKIEEIVRLFEDHGIDTGNRHVPPKLRGVVWNDE